MNSAELIPSFIQFKCGCLARFADGLFVTLCPTHTDADHDKRMQNAHSVRVIAERMEKAGLGQ